ncbi:MAG: response regulator transcription factor [Pseudomonadota bacterium]
MRLLVVEDNYDLASAISRGLRRSWYTVDVVENSTAADSALRANNYSAVLLDLGLPDGDGLDLLKSFRLRDNDTPVLILTARGALEDRVAGLDLGADDYMTKPFEFVELEARIRALLRRDAGRRGAVLEFGSTSYDTVARTVQVGSDQLTLPRRELLLFDTLALRLGQVVSKDQIIEGLAGFDEELSASAIELYVSRLRKKLQGSDLRIRTLRGLGYLMEEV